MSNAEANTTEHAATVAAQGATVAPQKTSSKKGATQKKGAPKGQKAAKSKAPAAAPKKGAKVGKKAAKPTRAKQTSTPRAESKGAKILALIGRAKGATLPRSRRPRIGRPTACAASFPPPPGSTASRSSPRRPRLAIGVYQIKK